MALTSLKFLSLLLVTLIIYYLFPKKYQWIVLLIFSFYFYLTYSYYYLFYLLSVTLISYASGLLIKKISNKKLILIVTIALLLSCLLILKYASFILGIFNIEFTISSLNFDYLVLPIGLSFYIFQSIGYVIDVFRESIEPEKNLFKYALYISYFPHILQGPLESYGELKDELFKEHNFNPENASKNIERIIWGIFKKIVVANNITIAYETAWEQHSYNGVLVWIALIFLYAMQLYADFSGYMDIVIGSSNLFGIRISENFDKPYFSKSISEYWRRWHITLGAWFRNYVFYSFLRSKPATKFIIKIRKKKNHILNSIPTLLALLLVWSLIGLWHGAAWAFIIHGLYHCFFISISTLLEPVYKKFRNRYSNLCNSRAYSLFQILRTFTIVCAGYLLFKTGDLSVSNNIARQAINGFGFSELLNFCSINYREVIKSIIGIVILFIVDIKSKENYIYFKNDIFRYFFYALLLVAILYLGVYSRLDLNSFAYSVF